MTKPHSLVKLKFYSYPGMMEDTHSYEKHASDVKENEWPDAKPGWGGDEEVAVDNASLGDFWKRCNRSQPVGTEIWWQPIMMGSGRPQLRKNTVQRRTKPRSGWLSLTQ